MHISLSDFASQPLLKALKYWLDHHHSSYQHDLHGAAVSALRRQMRGQGQAQAQAVGQGQAQQAQHQALPGQAGPLGQVDSSRRQGQGQGQSRGLV